MVQVPDAQPDQPQEPAATPPAGGASVAPQDRPPYYRTAANESAHGVPTPPDPFVRPANAPLPQPHPAPTQAPPPLQPQTPQTQTPVQPPVYDAGQPPRTTTPPPGYAPQTRPASTQVQPQVQQSVQRQSAPVWGAPPVAAEATTQPMRVAARNSALRCPNCGGPVTSETETCPTCGETLQGKLRMVRCRHCGGKGSSRLTLCPHCGRTLKPAPSRLLTLALPAAIVVLLLALFAFQSDSGNPLGWAAARARAASAWVSAFSAGLDPQLEIIPAADANAAAALPTAPVGVPPAAVDSSLLPSGMAVVSDTHALTASVETSAETLASVAMTATTEAADAPVAVPSTATPPQATPTALPTETPAPTNTVAPTNTPSALNYTVVRGDAAQSIAARFGVTLEALLLANNLTESEATLLQPGENLVIPLPSGGTGSATGSLYTVRQGDTLIGIAARTGVTVDVLQQANELSDVQAASLQPGDSLVIPAPTAAPTATAMPSPTQSPAATAGTTAAATAVAVAPNGMRYAAPLLRAPQDGATIGCDAGRLQWEPVPGLQADEKYRVHLGFVSERDDAGNVSITWLIQQDIASNITQVGVPASFCDKSSDAMGNQWRWYVEAVANSGGALVPVSPTSNVWGFAWKESP